MKADYPRAIDRYIDFFGGDTWVRSPALDTRTPATADSRRAEPRDLTASDDQPDRHRPRP
jgi:hypothetical protein